MTQLKINLTSTIVRGVTGRGVFNANRWSKTRFEDFVCGLFCSKETAYLQAGEVWVYVDSKEAITDQLKSNLRAVWPDAEITMRWPLCRFVARDWPSENSETIPKEVTVAD